MGGKQDRKGKRLLLYPSCILAIFLLLTGCALTSNSKKIRQEPGHLKMAEKFVVKGDYEKALNEYEAALKLFPKVTPGDRTVFNMGLIWAHPDNPKRDCKKSAMYFQQVIRDFPDSRLSKEAEIWIYSIDELISCKSKIKTLEKSVAYLKKKIKKNQRMVDTLKKIDMGVEEKKRESLPR